LAVDLPNTPLLPLIVSGPVAADTGKILQSSVSGVAWLFMGVVSWQLIAVALRASTAIQQNTVFCHRGTRQPGGNESMRRA
jgi:hypothetical protein